MRGLVTTTLTLSILAVSYPGAAEVTTPPAGGVQAMDPPDKGALDLARSTSKPVEVESMRSEARQVFAKPDGTFGMEQHVRPVRVHQAGGWVPVDTTLRLRPDGAVEPVAAAVGLTFSGGGDAPPARLAHGGKTLELGWTGTLPKPTLNGATATYAEVMPGVDLQVTAHVEGFSHVLVVKSRAAAAGLTELAYPLSADGLSMKADKAGNLEAVDGNGGTIFTASTPKMWDPE
jgi:hypothetical protein